MDFLERFSKTTQISNFMKIRRVGSELFHAGSRTDRHDESNSRFSQFCEKRLNITLTELHILAGYFLFRVSALN